MLSIPERLSKELTLYREKLGNLIGQVGMTASLYYARDMFELTDIFRTATEVYFGFIPADAINFYNNHEFWRPYKPRSLNRLLNRFAARDERGYWLDFAQIASDEDEDGPYAINELGDYGLCLAGRNHARSGSFRDSCVCSISCEFPADELLRSGCQAFLGFVERLASLSPFDSGHAGFTFKYSGRSDESEEHDWISYKAARFLAIHPQLQNFEYYTRHHIANVNWLTLLGTELSEKLGGADGMRSKLSDAVTVKRLKYGTMLIAGDSPPLGDVNQQAPDLDPLREVARLTRSLWIDDQTLKNDILNYFWHGDEEATDRWINRFELKFGPEASR